MLSQRTVGKLQHFLELMFSQLSYGSSPALDPAEYYRRLYEENVRPELLDCIGHEYQFHPSRFVRALHEGRPINWVNRTLYGNYSMSAEAEQEIGDTHLLVFAAVALRRYQESGYSHPPLVEAVRDFVDSVNGEGFRYSKGQIIGHDGETIKPVALNSTNRGDTGAPAAGLDREEEPAPTDGAEPRANDQNALLTNVHWSRGEKIALWSLVIAVLAGLAVWLVVPEFRAFLHLDKPAGERDYQQKRLYVAGTVVDIGTNRPVSQALVTVSGRTESYVTEDNGNFRLEFTAKQTEIGHLRIRVSKNGYRVYDASVTPPTDDLIVQLQKQ